jgi:galactokinase
VAGAVRALADAGVGVAPADLTISSTVPVGSGLSSSSALSVALVLALADGAGVTLEPIDVARHASVAETAATGVRGGLMDQLASVFGRAGHALLIDCRDDAITPVAIPPGIAIVVVHCGVPRTLVGSEYASRRAECEAIAADLGIASLRDATPVQVADHPRARHVVSENARVLEAAAALPLGDLSVLGPLLLASHASLRDDYDVSTPELDVLVELLVECGAAGARLTGAGFGGCVVALAQRNHADDVLAKTTLRYRDATGIEQTGFVARAVDGARRLD